MNKSELHLKFHFSYFNMLLLEINYILNRIKLYTFDFYNKIITKNYSLILKLY